MAYILKTLLILLPKCILDLTSFPHFHFHHLSFKPYQVLFGRLLWLLPDHPILTLPYPAPWRQQGSYKKQTAEVILQHKEFCWLLIISRINPMLLTVAHKLQHNLVPTGLQPRPATLFPHNALATLSGPLSSPFPIARPLLSMLLPMPRMPLSLSFTDCLLLILETLPCLPSLPALTPYLHQTTYFPLPPHSILPHAFSSLQCT